MTDYNSAASNPHYMTQRLNTNRATNHEEFIRKHGNHLEHNLSDLALTQMRSKRNPTPKSYLAGGTAGFTTEAGGISVKSQKAENDLLSETNRHNYDEEYTYEYLSTGEPITLNF